MSDTTCRTCGGPFEPTQRVCHFCGTSRQIDAASREQRAELEELREALAAALYQAEGQQDGLSHEVRDRFLQNAFVPSDPAVLIDAALHTQTLMVADVEVSDVPRARFETCLTRLELLAVDDPSLAKKVEILRRKLVAHRGRVRTSNITMSLVGIALLVGVIAFGVWVVRYLLG